MAVVNEKQENPTSKSKNMDTIEFLINVKYGDSLSFLMYINQKQFI